MRKTILYIWTFAAILLLTIALLLYSETFIGKLQSYKYERDRKKIKVLKENVYSVYTIDSLLVHNQHLMIVVGSIGCSACDLIMLSEIPDKLNIPRFFIEKKAHPVNDLVSQALYASGVPTSFLIDKDYNILGSFYGNIDLAEKLTVITVGKEKTSHHSFDGVSENDALKMLSRSLQSLNAFLAGDYQNMYRKAMESLGFGSYAFNNYMMYKYHRSESGDLDSVNYYKERALAHIEHMGDAIVYESLLRELDPANEFLLWIDENMKPTMK